MPEMSQFAHAVVTEIRKHATEFQIGELEGENSLDKIITIKTPGFVLPDEARKALRDLVAEMVPAAFRITFRFDPAGGR